MSARIPSRFFTEPWPQDNEWVVGFAVNANGYVTRVVVNHRWVGHLDHGRTRMGPSATLKIDHGDSILEIVRGLIVTSSIEHMNESERLFDEPF